VCIYIYTHTHEGLCQLTHSNQQILNPCKKPLRKKTKRKKKNSQSLSLSLLFLDIGEGEKKISFCYTRIADCGGGARSIIVVIKIHICPNEQGNEKAKFVDRGCPGTYNFS